MEFGMEGKGALLNSMPLTATEDKTKWLTDQDIDLYLTFLTCKLRVESDVNILIVGPTITAIVKCNPKMARCHFNREDVMKRQLLIFILNNSTSECEGDHWSVLVHSKRESMWLHLDSVEGSGNFEHAMYMVKSWRSMLKLRNKLNKSPVEGVCTVQTNAYDCGYHVLANVEHIIEEYLNVGHIKQINMLFYIDFQYMYNTMEVLRRQQIPYTNCESNVEGEEWPRQVVSVADDLLPMTVESFGSTTKETIYLPDTTCGVGDDVELCEENYSHYPQYSPSVSSVPYPSQSPSQTSPHLNLLEAVPIEYHISDKDKPLRQQEDAVRPVCGASADLNHRLLMKDINSLHTFPGDVSHRLTENMNPLHTVPDGLHHLTQAAQPTSAHLSGAHKPLNPTRAPSCLAGESFVNVPATDSGNSLRTSRPTKRSVLSNFRKRLKLARNGEMQNATACNGVVEVYVDGYEGSYSKSHDYSYLNRGVVKQNGSLLKRPCQQVPNCGLNGVYGQCKKSKCLYDAAARTDQNRMQQGTEGDLSVCFDKNFMQRTGTIESDINARRYLDNNPMQERPATAGYVYFDQHSMQHRGADIVAGHVDKNCMQRINDRPVHFDKHSLQHRDANTVARHFDQNCMQRINDRPVHFDKHSTQHRDANTVAGHFDKNCMQRINDRPVHFDKHSMQQRDANTVAGHFDQNCMQRINDRPLHFDKYSMQHRSANTVAGHFDKNCMQRINDRPVHFDKYSVQHRSANTVAEHFDSKVIQHRGTKESDYNSMQRKATNVDSVHFGKRAATEGYIYFDKNSMQQRDANPVAGRFDKNCSQPRTANEPSVCFGNSLQNADICRPMQQISFVDVNNLNTRKEEEPSNFHEELTALIVKCLSENTLNNSLQNAGICRPMQQISFVDVNNLNTSEEEEPSNFHEELTALIVKCLSENTLNNSLQNAGICRPMQQIFFVDVNNSNSNGEEASIFQEQLTALIVKCLNENTLNSSVLNRDTIPRWSLASPRPQNVGGLDMNRQESANAYNQLKEKISKFFREFRARSDKSSINHPDSGEITVCFDKNMQQRARKDDSVSADNSYVSNVRDQEELVINCNGLADSQRAENNKQQCSEVGLMKTMSTQVAKVPRIQILSGCKEQFISELFCSRKNRNKGNLGELPEVGGNTKNIKTACVIRTSDMPVVSLIDIRTSHIAHCKHCDIYFEHPASLAKHMAACHSSTSTSTSSAPTCTHCSTDADTPSQLHSLGIRQWPKVILKDFRASDTACVVRPGVKTKPETSSQVEVVEVKHSNHSRVELDPRKCATQTDASGTIMKRKPCIDKLQLPCVVVLEAGSLLHTPNPTTNKGKTLVWVHCKNLRNRSAQCKSSTLSSAITNKDHIVKSMQLRDQLGLACEVRVVDMKNTNLLRHFPQPRSSSSVKQSVMDLSNTSASQPSTEPKNPTGLITTQLNVDLNTTKSAQEDERVLTNENTKELPIENSLGKVDQKKTSFPLEGQMVNTSLIQQGISTNSSSLEQTAPKAALFADHLTENPCTDIKLERQSARIKAKVRDCRQVFSVGHDKTTVTNKTCSSLLAKCTPVHPTDIDVNRLKKGNDGLNKSVSNKLVWRCEVPLVDINNMRHIQYEYRKK